jgi:acetyl esterase/lipase
MARAGWLLVVLLFTGAARAQEAPDIQRTRDVIYGRKYGMALTLDVLAPKKANGLGVIFVVSGGWFSRSEAINPAFCKDFLRRGYTVFAVVHGSQPKFTVPEIVEDMHRAVRYIRCHARDYKVDPERLGVTGVSAGGHLSLLLGTSGRPGDPKAPDPVDRCSSRVQAVACFVPPTDFLNWGLPGNEMTARKLRPPFCAALDFREYDRDRALYLPVTDEDKERDILKKISPITYVTPDDPPTLIIAGEKDDLVPVQQSETMVARLKAAKVPAELIVKKGAGHVWASMLDDTKAFGDWFDKYLAKAPAKAEKKPEEAKSKETKVPQKN